MFQRVLIANRGEIAVRIARGCRELGVSPVAVYSEADAAAAHVAAADAAVCIGPAPSAQSYLNIEAIVAAARDSGADAVHPGYGFLAENAAFAQAVIDAGLTFIGPRPEAIATMGDKTRARAVAIEAGVPVLPALEPLTADADSAALVAAVGLPAVIKAAAGGGGRGMRIVRDAADLADARTAAAREARGAFGDDRLYAERYVERPRHVEVQVLADTHGALVHLGERECSIQRRHQKLIEECPSPAVDAALRRRMTDAALALARAVDYTGAGTVEFLLDDTGAFYFLEMNTRLQVEHPVTEAVWGVDLVQAQLRIAAGEPLWLAQDALVPRGHAIECRLTAEDPAQGFVPAPDRIRVLAFGDGAGVRVDAGVRAGDDVPVHYDPLIAKLIVHAADREGARARMQRALADTVILGPPTTTALLADVVAHPAFRDGALHTHFLETHFADWQPGDDELALAALAALLVPATAGDAPADGPWHTLSAWRAWERA